MLALGGGTEPEALQALVEMTDSVMTYRSRYASRFQLGAVLDLLVCDETNPRSIAYQLVQCVAHVDELRLGAHRVSGGVDRGPVNLLVRTIRNTDIVRIACEFERGERGSLDRLLGTIDVMLRALSEAISHRYFFHSGPIQRLTEFDS
jgi:uncharacterized alpha-E superfamily protein